MVTSKLRPFYFEILLHCWKSMLWLESMSLRSRGVFHYHDIQIWITFTVNNQMSQLWRKLRKMRALLDHLKILARSKIWWISIMLGPPLACFRNNARGNPRFQPVAFLEFGVQWQNVWLMRRVVLYSLDKCELVLHIGCVSNEYQTQMYVRMYVHLYQFILIDVASLLVQCWTLKWGSAVVWP